MIFELLPASRHVFLMKRLRKRLISSETNIFKNIGPLQSIGQIAKLHNIKSNENAFFNHRIQYKSECQNLIYNNFSNQTNLSTLNTSETEISSFENFVHQRKDQIENLKNQILQNTKIIDNDQECLQIVKDIMSSQKSADHIEPVIFFNCLGVSKSNEKIELFQIGTQSGQIYLFDSITCPSIVTSGGLKNLLESEHIAKVMHNCALVSAKLFSQFEITLTNVFDTMVKYKITL